MPLCPPSSAPWGSEPGLLLVSAGVPVSSQISCSILIISHAQFLLCLFCVPSRCRQGCGSLLITLWGAGDAGCTSDLRAHVLQPCLAALFLLIKYASPPS